MSFETYSKKFRELAYNNGYSEVNINKCLNYAEPLIRKGLPVIYNTSHLSSLVGYNKKYIKRAVQFTPYFYRNFTVPKKDRKSVRRIREPLPSLKEIQHWIFHEILYNIPVSKYSKSYIPGRNIKDNVKYHKKQKIVLTLDIKDFFPSITLYQVQSIFKELGYSTLISNLLAKLCCLDNSIPQGAPTSAYISNIVMLDFDKIMETYSKETQIRYTRYADDLAFSGNFESEEVIAFVNSRLKKIGFDLNRKKTRIMKINQRQHITGVVVNEKLQIPREERKKIRQAVYFIKKYGLNDHLKKINQKKANYIQHLAGRAKYMLFICYQKTNMFDFRKVGMHQKWKIRMHDFTAILF